MEMMTLPTERQADALRAAVTFARNESIGTVKILTARLLQSGFEQDDIDAAIKLLASQTLASRLRT